MNYQSISHFYDVATGNLYHNNGRVVAINPQNPPALHEVEEHMQRVERVLRKTGTIAANDALIVEAH